MVLNNHCHHCHHSLAGCSVKSWLRCLGDRLFDGWISDKVGAVVRHVKTMPTSNNNDGRVKASILSMVQNPSRVVPHSPAPRERVLHHFTIFMISHCLHFALPSLCLFFAPGRCISRIKEPSSPPAFESIQVKYYQSKFSCFAHRDQ
jgi:hypothetical protein